MIHIFRREDLWQIMDPLFEVARKKKIQKSYKFLMIHSYPQRRNKVNNINDEDIICCGKMSGKR